MVPTFLHTAPHRTLWIEALARPGFSFLHEPAHQRGWLVESFTFTNSDMRLIYFLMRVFHMIMISGLTIGAIWATVRLGGETISAVGGKRENPPDSSFRMTRTFVCHSCGDSFPATAEEMTRRMDAGQRVYPPDISADRSFFVCEREGTPTVELIIDAQPNP